MKQISFASAEFGSKKKVTRRERFLAVMEQVMPWGRLLAAIEPHYPRGEGRGRPPIGLERMLRLYFVQQWYALSDEGLEDALYDMASLRQFVGIDLAVENVPDATTVLKFRRLLETHRLTATLLGEINAHLSGRGLLMRSGTIVDATIIAAPPSTKNKQQTRDPEMHQAKKGQQWHFGMKAHIGVDVGSGLVHSVHATAANEADVAHAHEVLHGQESEVYADAGYTGVDKRAEITDAQDRGEIRPDVHWHVAAKRGSVKAMAEGLLKRLTVMLERKKAQVRARVEHPFHVVKNLFGHKKTRYKGLAKNAAQLLTLFGLANLVLAKRRLLALQGIGAS